MNEEETKRQEPIPIPIKAIIEQSMKKNNANYQEDEFNLLRKYFIACLNLGFLQPNDLNNMIDKFSSKIKFIVINYNGVNKMDYYVIDNGVLYINGSLKYDRQTIYEINFYKAVTEVIWNANDKNIGISNALTNMAAEKIYNMDANESRIIMTRESTEQIGDEKITLNTGYFNYNLIISLLEQLFISKKINENKIIHDMYFEGYNNVLKTILTDDNTKFLIEVLDKLCILYINRRVINKINTSEKALLDKYQIMVNDIFTKVDHNYFAFLALITSDDLRNKCLKKIQNNNRGV